MLDGLLQEHRSVLLERWQNLIFETYPSSSNNFLSQKSNQFANPVGHTIKEDTSSMLDALIAGEEDDVLLARVDGIVRVRAVQDFTPSQAVSFVFLLKDVIRGMVSETAPNDSLETELVEFEKRIDRMALATFESYMLCRQKIFDIRVREIKDRSAMLQERMHRTQIEAARQAKLEDNNNES